MNKDIFYKYAPSLLMVIAILMQYNLFVRPENLEYTHREILAEISQMYITKSEFSNMKEQILDINKKLDKIYDTLINERNSDGINWNWIRFTRVFGSYE